MGFSDNVFSEGETVARVNEATSHSAAVMQKMTSLVEADTVTLLSRISHLEQEVEQLQEQSRVLTEEHRQLEEQVQLAGQVQRDLLPENGICCGLEIRTIYCPCDRISGDIYDISRLDENRVGISLADACGHGVSAGLLTMLLKHSFCGKRIGAGTYRVLSPAEVLQRVNHDVLVVDFKQCQFVTGMHAVYDETTRQVTFARGGLPYPILLREGQPAKQLFAEGPIMGAFEDAQFETLSVDLIPGDAMLFFSDGLEALLLGRKGTHPFDDISDTPWFAGLNPATLFDAVDNITSRLDSISSESWPADDVTVIALRVLG